MACIDNYWANGNWYIDFAGPLVVNETMQNRFLRLDTFFICLSYGVLKVGIGDGPTVFDKTQARARKSIFCVKYYKNVALNHL